MAIIAFSLIHIPRLLGGGKSPRLYNVTSLLEASTGTVQCSLGLVPMTCQAPPYAEERGLASGDEARYGAVVVVLRAILILYKLIFDPVCCR